MRGLGRTGRTSVAAAVIAAAVAALAPVAAGARDTWTEPYPGVRYLRREVSSPRAWRIFAVTVDLTRRDVRVRATKDADRNIVTSTFASRYGCPIAVNGDFSRLSDRQPTGLALGDGERWEGTRDRGGHSSGAEEGFIAFGRDNRAHVSYTEEVVEPPEGWMKELVSGRPNIVVDGAAVDPWTCEPHFCARHPRTAAGLSQDGATLILAVVDGRSTLSVGMTSRELGELMQELGAWRAINLDGGGSSTMYVEAAGGVVNAPSDGTQRRVANHIGIAIVEPFGELTGVVREGDVHDDTRPIAGATVRLSSGESATTDEAGRYRFERLAAGEVGITVEAQGYATGTRTAYVAADDVTWGSVALQAALAGDGAGGAGGAGGTGGTGGEDVAGGSGVEPGAGGEGTSGGGATPGGSGGGGFPAGAAGGGGPVTVTGGAGPGSGEEGRAEDAGEPAHGTNELITGGCADAGGAGHAGLALVFVALALALVRRGRCTTR